MVHNVVFYKSKAGVSQLGQLTIIKEMKLVLLSQAIDLHFC